MYIDRPSELTQSDFDNNEGSHALNFEDPRLDSKLTDLVWSLDRLPYPSFEGKLVDLYGLAG